MCNDFYDKYDEYMNVVAERKDRTMRQTNYSLANVEDGHMADFVEKAVSSLALLILSLYHISIVFARQVFVFMVCSLTFYR